MSLSLVHGDEQEPLIEDTIGAALEARAKETPDGVALIVPYQGVRWTWSELNARTDELATGLIARGLKPGERIGIWSPNRVEWVLTQFATAKAGLILVNINPAYRLPEVEYALNKVACRALITSPAFKSSDYVGMLRELGPKRLPELEMVVTLGNEAHDGFIPIGELMGPADPQRLRAIAETLDRHDAVNIQFTSGTTGFPKGATLTHRNILNNGHFVAKCMGLRGDDRLCIPVPLYHCFGMVIGNLASLSSGAAMVFPGEAFDPLATLATVHGERCTVLHGVPTMFIAMLNHPDFARFDLSSLRAGCMGGSPCPVTTMRETIDRMHMREVTIVYGMTETSPVSFQTATDDSMEERVGTVGRVQPHLEVKIIDESGRIVPRGQPGELCTRGYSVMRGYWGDERKTAEAIDSEGWMHSGDLATIDDQGYCRITGRIKDMIIRGGENIYPREVEEYLLTHADIIDAQVIGVPDHKYGEEVCVWVIRRDGAVLDEEGVRAFCRGQIAHYKIPRYVRFVDGFPLTVTGKVQKFEMRKAMETLCDYPN